MAEEKIGKNIVSDELLSILRMVSPGKGLRTAIDNISKASTGALIVVGDISELKRVISGGFEIECKFTPQKLVELCKMDGAVIIDDNTNRIVHVNALLIPDPTIKTEETGTRHQAAERTAKQTKQLAIAISEKKKTVSLYYGNMKYVLRNTEELLNRAAEESRMLEKHKEAFKELMLKLNFLEFANMVNLEDMALAVQRAEIISKITGIIQKYIIQLGEEGELMKMQLKELIKGVEDEELLVLKDYSKRELFTTKVELNDLPIDKLVNLKSILETMGYFNEETVKPKGYRVLSKTSLSKNEIEELVQRFSYFHRILETSPDELISDKIDKVRVLDLQKELTKVRESTVW
jgi:diadenylate cyclase